MISDVDHLFMSIGHLYILFGEVSIQNLCPFFFKKYFIYLFLERGREGEKEGEKHQRVVASYSLPTGDLACNPGMCPDWESKQQPFGS